MRNLTTEEILIRKKFTTAKLVIPSFRYKNTYIEAVKNGFFDYDQSYKALLDNDYFSKFLDDINSSKAWLSNEECYVYWLIYNEEFIGRIRLKNLSLQFDSYRWYQDEDRLLNGHLGYGIVKEFRNKGLGTLLLSLGLDLIKKENINKVFCYIEKENIPSIKVAQRCGFTFSDQHYFKEIDSFIPRYVKILA